jgi:Protein of unknown function (DUF3592)
MSDLGLRRFAVTWLLGAIATVVLLAVLTGVTLTNHGWWGYLRLVRGGATTQGVVARTEPRNHCLAEYAFAIDGRQYRGAGPYCGAMVGQKVAVTYLTTDPNQSCLGAAREHLNNDLATFVAGGVIFPPMIIAAWRRRRRAA